MAFLQYQHALAITTYTLSTISNLTFLLKLWRLHHESKPSAENPPGSSSRPIAWWCQNKRIFFGLGIIESVVAFVLGIVFFVLSLTSPHTKLWPLILFTTIVLFSMAEEVSLEQPVRRNRD